MEREKEEKQEKSNKCQGGKGEGPAVGKANKAGKREQAARKTLGWKVGSSQERGGKWEYEGMGMGI